MSPLFIGLKYVSLKDVGLKDVSLKDVLVPTLYFTQTNSIHWSFLRHRMMGAFVLGTILPITHPSKFSAS